MILLLLLVMLLNNDDKGDAADGNVVEDDGKDDWRVVEDGGDDDVDDRDHPALAKLERESVNPLMDRVSISSLLLLLIKIIIFIISVIKIIIFNGQPSDGQGQHFLPSVLPFALHLLCFAFA